MNKKILLTVALLAVSLVAFNCKPKGNNTEKDQEQASANTQGQDLYNVNCASCHGEKGLADTPTANALKPKPRNFAAEKLVAGDTVEDVAKVIREGFNGGKTGMVSFKASFASDDEITAVAKYVLELAGKK